MNEYNDEKINQGENNTDKSKITMRDIQLIKSYNQGLKLILNLYTFNNDLKRNIIQSETLDLNSTFYKGECYLIREDWFSHILNFYCYEEIYRISKNNQNKKNDNKTNIILDIMQNYEKKFLEKKINILDNRTFDEENLFKIEFFINNSKTEMLFNYQYILINQNILEYKNQDIQAINLYKLYYVINQQKIIIRNDSQKSIIIGVINDSDIKNVFVPEIILAYNDLFQMNNQFHYFESNQFELFAKMIDTKEKISDIKDIEGNIFGKIYIIDKNKYINLGSIKKNILSGLYNNYENINKKLKLPYNKEINHEKYYLINNKYIQQLKKFFLYDQNYNNKEDKIYSKFDISLIRNKLMNEELLQIKKSELKIDDNKSLSFFNEFDLISNELKEYLLEYGLIHVNQELIEVECLVGNNKLIIHSFLPDKKIAIVLSKNDKERYKFELIFVFDDEIKLENYLKIIKEKGFDNVFIELHMNDKKCDILDEKNEKYGKAFEISFEENIVIDVKEDIFNMIKIYLFNKDFTNKIVLSQKKDIINANIFSEKCFLINREYIEKYKEYYLYEDIKKYLDNINNDYIISNENIEIILQNLIKEDLFKNLVNKKKLSTNDIKVKPKEKKINEDIFYLDNFVIVNEDIYKQILLSFNQNIISDFSDTQYIINSGKIFLFMNINDKNQLLIGEINDFNICFNEKVLIIFNDVNNFKDFKNDLMKTEFFSCTKHFLIKIEDNKKLFIKSIKKEIGIIYDLKTDNDILNEIEEEKLENVDNNIINNIIELLIGIYLNLEKIKRQINEKDDYYIINNDFFEYLNQYYNYDKIIKNLNDNNIFKKYLEESLSIDKFVLKKEIVDFVIKKNNNFIFMQGKLDIQKNVEIKNLIQKLNYENHEKLFLNNFTIINEKIKKALENIFNIKSIETIFIKAKCLIKKNFIYVLYILNDSYLVNIGKFKENEFLYETKILLEFNSKDYLDGLLNKNDNFNKEIDKLIDILLKDNNNFYKKIEDENKNEKGKIYLIKKDENNVPIENEKTHILNSSLTKSLLNNSNLDIKNKQLNITSILQKDIGIIIKYIFFQKNLFNAIACSKIDFFYKYFDNCYLTNIIMWYKYKTYFFYQKLNEIIIEQSKALKPINNKSNNVNDNKINEIKSTLIHFLSNNPEFYDEKQANSVISSLQNSKDFELIFNNFDFNEKTVFYPSLIEIIDQFTFDDLIKRNNNISEANFIKCDIIVNEQKLIIKLNKSNKIQSNQFIILIGHFDNEFIFNIEYPILFSEEKNRQEFFESFLKNKFSDNIEKYKPYFLEINNISKKFIIFDDNAMNFDEKHIGDKMVKLFLFYYLFSDEINRTLKTSIKDNGRRFYYLINKEWMKIYKEHYDYKKLCGYFDEMRKKQTFTYYYNQLVTITKNKNYEKINEFIFHLIDKIPTNILKVMEEQKSSQNDLEKKLNNKQLCINKNKHKIGNEFSFIYHSENELISCELFYLFEQLETDFVKNSIKNNSEKIECLIGENKLLILSEYDNQMNKKQNYYLLNVGYIQKCRFSPSIFIYFYEKKDLENMIAYLNANIFSDFIESYNLIDYSSCNIKNSNKKNIGKITRITSLSDEFKNIIENANIINPESMKLIKLILYFKIFIKKSKASLKNNKENKGYFVKSDFINDIEKIYGYKHIDNYINQNSEIQDIINNSKSSDSIENLTKNIQKKFNINIIKEINKKKININIKGTSYKVGFETISLTRTNYVQFANQFVILNEEMYNLFKGFTLTENYFNKFLAGDDKIFITNDSQKTILIYSINEKYVLNLDLILQQDNDKNSLINLIKNNGFNKFKDYLLFDNDKVDDIVSPIFYLNQKKIGTAYKYNTSIKDYVKDIICFDMRKIFVLYLNYKKLSIQKNNTFLEYFIVNKNWIQKYKNFFNFDSLYKEIEKISNINDIINSLNEKEDGAKIISDKKLTLMLKKIPKTIIHQFKENDKEFEKKYKNIETKIPQITGMEYLDILHQTSSIFFYYDFEIIDSKIYKYLFEKIDTDINFEKTFFGFKKSIGNETEKVWCLFDNNRVIIKLKDINGDKKYALYIGHINPDFSFEIECFLFYNNKSLMEEHIQKILNLKGFNSFCEDFYKLPINIKELEVDNKKYGFALKRIQNLNWDFKYDDNDVITKYFKYAPKVGLANIGATCYMNATLQCFCQIVDFASYFKYHRHINEICSIYQNKEEDCLTASFKILIEEIWPQNAMNEDSSKRVYEPHEFRQKIAKMNSLFENVEANDAKDLVNFIIMTLHEELNEPLNDDSNLMINNQEDPREVFRVFYEQYKNNFRSKISELFYAIQQTQTQCLICNKILFNFQAYFFLVFPLEEVKKYAINNLNLQKNNNFPFMNNINNCINYPLGTNNNMNNINISNVNNMNNNMMNMSNNPNFNNNMNFTGINNNMMNSMNMMNNNYGILNTNINSPHSNMNNYLGMVNKMQNLNQNNGLNHNLIVNQKHQKLNNNIVDLIDCFEYNRKIEKFTDKDKIYCNKCNTMTEANYSSFLETTPKVLIILLNRGTGIQFKIKLEFTTELDISQYVNQNNGGIKYKLIGVITHLGESGASGHFIAHCLSPIDNQWYTYNDAIVSKIDDFHKQIIDLGMPYLLFYKKVGN